MAPYTLRWRQILVGLGKESINYAKPPATICQLPVCCQRLVQAGLVSFDCAHCGKAWTVELRQS